MIAPEAPAIDTTATGGSAALYTAIHDVVEEGAPEDLMYGLETMRHYATAKAMLILAVDINESAFASDEKTRRVADQVFKGCIQGYVFAGEIING